jgi:hypothetical protein
LIAEIEPPQIVVMVKGIEASGVGDLAKLAFQIAGQIFRLPTIRPELADI